MTTLTKPTAFDKMLESAIGKLIDLDTITERLLATDCQQCSLFTREQVQHAFLKWVEHNLDSIEEQPEWFLNNEPKHFYRHLPFDDLQESTDLREYDYEEMYEAMVSEGDRDPDDVSLEVDLWAPHNASSLEDDFDGTPKEAAIKAIYW
ncbi:hypothetical protein [Microcoleus sp. herbarium14]|uniref:hypothetical protein n=1 Tax=Microcoleus sp. herbarium14 TaxID=3055439 RepID=UPI002FD397BD